MCPSLALARPPLTLQAQAQPCVWRDNPGPAWKQLHPTQTQPTSRVENKLHNLGGGGEDCNGPGRGGDDQRLTAVAALPPKIGTSGHLP